MNDATSRRKRAGRSRYPRRAFLRSAALAGCGFTSAALAGCTGRTAQRATTSPPQAGSGTATAGGGSPQPGGAYNVAASSNAGTLDPHATSVNITSTQLSYSLSRLLRFKTGTDPQTFQNYEVENDLAQSVESPDGVTWTVKLRPNAKFHNIPPVSGHPVEAEDVKATFTRALNKPENPNRGNLDMIDPNQIETPARDTIVFKLNYKLSVFHWILVSATYAYILPREALAGTYDPAKVVIGSGPFLLESYQPDDAFVYKKNPEWFEPGLPYLDGVRCPIITDPSQRLAQFTAGHLDEFGPQQQDLDTAKRSNPKAELLTYMTNSGAGYPPYFPFKDPSSPFQDIRLRQAVSLAIDRDTISRALYAGQTEPVYALPAGYGKWALKQNELSAQAAPFYKYDPARAKQLLAAAGVSNLSIKMGHITNFAPAEGLVAKVVEAVANMLNAAGFQCPIVGLDYIKDYIGGGKGARFGNFPGDMVLMDGYTTFSGPDEALFNYWDSHSSANHFGLKDPKLDALIDKARGTLNEADQVTAYKDVQRYMTDQIYGAWGMPQNYSYTMLQPRVQNYNVSSQLSLGAETYAKVWLKK